jgi:hypothetical protein
MRRLLKSDADRTRLASKAHPVRLVQRRLARQASDAPRRLLLLFLPVPDEEADQRDEDDQ